MEFGQTLIWKNFRVNHEYQYNAGKNLKVLRFKDVSYLMTRPDNHKILFEDRGLPSQDVAENFLTIEEKSFDELEQILNAHFEKEMKVLKENAEVKHEEWFQKGEKMKEMQVELENMQRNNKNAPSTTREHAMKQLEKGLRKQTNRYTHDKALLKKVESDLEIFRLSHQMSLDILQTQKKTLLK